MATSSVQLPLAATVPPLAVIATSPAAIAPKLAAVPPPVQDELVVTGFAT